MKTFVEQMKEMRDDYLMGFYNHEQSVSMALVYAVQYIGLKRWNDGYENIVRNLFPRFSRMVKKSVQPNGYDTDDWIDKYYFELYR